MSSYGSFGMYICVADNDAGNATVTVSLPSLARPSTSTSVPPTTTPPTTRTTTTATAATAVRWSISGQDIRELDRHQPGIYLDDSGDNVAAIDARPTSVERMFTVTDMVWAVVGSHVITLLLCLVLGVGVCWRTKLGRRCLGCPTVDDSSCCRRDLAAGGGSGTAMTTTTDSGPDSFVSPLPPPMTTKDVYAFDVVTGEFRLDRRRSPSSSKSGLVVAVSSSDGGRPSASTADGTLLRTTTTLPSKDGAAIQTPSSWSTLRRTTAAANYGTADEGRRDEWVRRLLADYRTQQQQQQLSAAAATARSYRTTTTMTSANGFPPRLLLHSTENGGVRYGTTGGPSTYRR